MHCTKRITADMLWVGADDRRLAVFEGVYGVPDGVSYNSYLINDEKTILFDTVDKAVAHNFFDNVAYGLSGRKLDYLVISHMEPDHAATIEDIALRYPEATIVCNAKIRDHARALLPHRPLRAGCTSSRRGTRSPPAATSSPSSWPPWSTGPR